MIRIFIISFILCAAIQNSLAASVATKIENLIKETDPDVNIGIKISNISQNKEVYSLNSGRYFVFGSGLKIMPIFSILDYYGPEYKFSSNIILDKSNAYLQVHDPDFSITDLQSMISQLNEKLSGKTINNFYIVKDEFTVPAIVREKVVADSEYCYGTQISKVHINKNCTIVSAKPMKVGENIEISYGDIMPYKINNEAVTVSKKTLDRIHTSIKGGTLNISGTLSVATGKVSIGAVINDSVEHLQYMVKEILVNQGIKIKGKVLITNELPNDSKVIVSHSKMLKSLASKAIIKSDNFITDYLLAHYADKYKADEWRKATYQLKKLIKDRFDVDLFKTTIHDGSGLSRGNIITVNHFDQFLVALSKKSNFEEIKKMFGKPGDEGTMKNRLIGQTNIYAKTGTLTNVTALVGYYYNNKQELNSFVVVINNYFGNRQKYRNLIDEIVITAKSS